MNLPVITVTQVQFRNAMIDLALYSQWDSNFMSQGTDKGRVYYNYAPLISSDSEHFNDQNTMLTELERYAVFQLAQTL